MSTLTPIVCLYLSLCRIKIVDAEVGAEVFRALDLDVLQGRAGRIGDAVDGVEEGDDGGGIDEGRCSSDACARVAGMVVTVAFTGKDVAEAA